MKLTFTMICELKPYKSEGFILGVEQMERVQVRRRKLRKLGKEQGQWQDAGHQQQQLLLDFVEFQVVNRLQSLEHCIFEFENKLGLNQVLRVLLRLDDVFYLESLQRQNALFGNAELQFVDQFFNGLVEFSELFQVDLVVLLVQFVLADESFRVLN